VHHPSTNRTWNDTIGDFKDDMYEAKTPNIIMVAGDRQGKKNENPLLFEI